MAEPAATVKPSTTPASADSADKPKDLNGSAAVQAAADADNPQTDISPATAQNATDWFLSDDEDDTVAWAWLPVNVAPAGRKERIVDFKIQVVDRDIIQTKRKEATRTKADGTEEMDGMEANLRIAVEGLLEPNVKGDAKMRHVRGQDFIDPGDALRARFAHKPGVIDAIAGKILEISGYGSNDVKEVKAAGN